MNGESTLDVIMCNFFAEDKDRTREGCTDDKQTDRKKQANESKQTNTSTSKELELFGEGEGIFNWC